MTTYYDVCDDPECVACRTLEYVHSMAEQGNSPGELLVAISAAMGIVYDANMEVVTVPREFADDRPNDDEVLH